MWRGSRRRRTARSSPPRTAAGWPPARAGDGTRRPSLLHRRLSRRDRLISGSGAGCQGSRGPRSPPGPRREPSSPNNASLTMHPAEYRCIGALRSPAGLCDPSQTYADVWYCVREMYGLHMSVASLWRCAAAALVAAALVVACTQIQASAVPQARPAPLLGPAPPVRVGADQVTLLRSGPATFARIESLIDAARASIHVEVYEFGQRRLAAALVAAQSRGVSVTVIDDPSELSSVATSTLLRTAGVDVVDYPVRRQMIDHVKLLVVDAAVAVVGGINWGVNSPANHDYDAEIRGPAVHNLDRVFARDLVTCGRDVTVPDAVADPSIVVAATLPGAEIRPLALGLIDGARHTLDLELFVLTDTGVVHALEAAALRGVTVRVLLDPSQPSSDPSYAALRGAGIQVRWYRSRGELLHAKAIVADEASILFGSANWSGGGFARNHEVDIDLISAPAVAAEMLAQMSLNWAASA